MYVELQVTSHFSFLRGASSLNELFSAASLLGYPALGISDRNTVCGLVRGLVAADETGVRLVTGCRLDLMDGASLLVWPQDRVGWSSLTRLLTEGKKRAQPQHGEKGHCFLHWEDVAAWSDGLVAALVTGSADEATGVAMAQTAAIFRDRAHATLSHHRRPGDKLRLHELDRMARRYGLRSLATGDILYDSPDKRMLQDVVTAIRNKCTIDELGFRRERHADRHLKSVAEMERRFRDYPDAIRATADVAERCTFSLRELSYQYPDEIVMSERSPQQALERLAHRALRDKFGGSTPPGRYKRLLKHEMRLVRKMRYAPYFLTVNSIVSYARSQGILCQGRGSAANSLICYSLGITSIDPIKHTLLFERFISGERDEPPDIDVDFEHERREQVIQWIYDTYGRDHAALTAVVSRFRARGAVREVGKALGLPEDVTGALAGQVWGWSQEGVEERHAAGLNLDSSEPRLALTLDLARQLIGTPRHLSQHPGGFVLTRAPLADLVPIEPAAMVDRQVIEWEKEDIEELKFMKVDVLGIGMMGCMRRGFDLLAEHKGMCMDLASPELQHDDPVVYDMICKADTLGTFQIESRAQMSMLPRMKPRTFYDIVIQVAIVRPGPIQGDMVHPYLRRREGKEVPEYPKPELEEVLKKTLGVPLFQEQAMKVAIVGAGFTAGEADQLRRSMATFKFTGGVGVFRDKMINGMIARGYRRDFAERTFKQIEGFGSYGFPESHAASFAKIAYASSWMKCHHPDIFCCALLNAQPMGFYAPAQIVRDAREHGVEVRPPCVNASGWDSAMEEQAPLSLEERGLRSLSEPLGELRRSWVRVTALENGDERCHPHPTSTRQQAAKSSYPSSLKGEGLIPLRLGMRVVRGLAEIHAQAILAARAAGPFRSIEDAWLRSGVPVAALERLAEADAFRSLGFDRRQALWQVRGLGEKQLPLFAHAGAREAEREPQVTLTPMTAGREVVEDYHSTQLTLRDHPLAFLRPELERRGIIRCADLAHVKNGRKVEVAGIILVRQKPGSAKGVLFITIEDETGIANGIIWPARFEAQRRVVLSSAMIGIKGTVQREGPVIHVIADRIEDYTPLLRTVGERDFPHRPGPGDGATHPGSPDRGDAAWEKRVRDSYHPPFRTGADPEDAIRQKSRDFH
ncbi:MAG TPA: error-prone DNA polymerase [Allosphingosinicella sp.]|jgi:error-prone DNA polymerase